MKTLRTLALAALLAASSAAHAQSNSWSLPNEAGGKIILSARPCPVPGSGPLREAYSYSANGARRVGCWALVDDLVQIAWENGRQTIFSPDDFTPSPGNRPVRPASKSSSL